MSKKPQHFGSDAFVEQINVSRETLKRLTILVERLTQWQTKINLVSKNTLEDAWQRHLLDSAQLAFMREVIRSTGFQATIISGRIEKYKPPAPARYITARALTSLDNLIELSWPLLAENGTCLFLKGRGVDEELTATREKWDIRAKKHPSINDSDGTVLEIDNIKAITHHD